MDKNPYNKTLKYSDNVTKHNISVENEQWVDNLFNNNSKYSPAEKKSC